MELKTIFSNADSEKLIEIFSSEFIELLVKAKEIAMECGQNYISTIHFFIADCELKKDESLYYFFYSNPSDFIKFKAYHISTSNEKKVRSDERVCLSEEAENVLDGANQERINNKQSLIHPAHFFVSSLTSRFFESDFFQAVKQNSDIDVKMNEFYESKKIFTIYPMTRQERNKYFLGPGLNDDWLSRGTTLDPYSFDAKKGSNFNGFRIHSELIYYLKHHFDLSLFDNIVSKSSTQNPDLTIISNEDFWSKAINNKLYPGQIVRLVDFKIHDWMGISPGITHTNFMKNLHKDTNQQFKERLNAKPRDLRKIVGYEDEENERIINSGQTAVRLSPKTIHNELQYILSATSEHSPISGIPITMNTSYFSEVVGDIKSDGSLDVNLVGRLMVLPSELSPINIKFERTVPKFYLEVFEMQKLPYSKRPGTALSPISVSITYAKKSDSSDQVSFHKISGSFMNNSTQLQKTVERLQEKAAEKSGESDPIIIGDFDEFFDHFENVEFPIKDMANGRFSMTKLLLYKKIFGININEFYMGDKNTIINSVAAIGSNAVASNNILSNHANNVKLNDLNFDLLIEELAKLRGELSSQAKTPEDFQAVGFIASAEIAAKENNVGKLINSLKKTNKWVFDVSTNIGVNLVSEVLKQFL